VHSRKLAALLVSSLLLLVALPGAVAAAGPSSQAQARADVLKFWTPERMKSAKWLDVTYDPVAHEGRLTPRSQFQPPSNTSSDSWNGTASNANDEMARVTGRVYFAFGRTAYICSGSVIRDGRAGYSTVLTAAHCVYDQRTGKFASQWMFIPDFDVAPTYTCASTFLGCWNAVSIVTRSEFTSTKKLTNNALQHDWAFVVVGGGGKTGTSLQLDVAVSLSGSATGLNLTATEQTSGTVMAAIGYPAAKPYDGKNLTYCQNPVTRDANTSNTTYKMSCLMTGGSSGGPWVLSAGSGFNASATSLNSYGYTGDTSMYGPIFNAGTQKTFDLAQTQSSGNWTTNQN
jgi:V8-like Glu-specific endopeptidase